MKEMWKDKNLFLIPPPYHPGQKMATTLIGPMTYKKQTYRYFVYDLPQNGLKLVKKGFSSVLSSKKH